MTDKASEIAKNIWLAGVGAYGRAVDEAQGRLEKAGVETPKLFRDLVEAGAALEEGARTGKEKEKVKESKSGRKAVEERISRVRENFHMQRPARIEDVADLHAKVDLISSKLDVIATALTEAGVIKVPARRKARTTTTPKKKKAPARKAAAGKKAAPGKKNRNPQKIGRREQPDQGPQSRLISPQHEDEGSYSGHQPGVVQRGGRGQHHHH